LKLLAWNVGRHRDVPSEVGAVRERTGGMSKEVADGFVEALRKLEAYTQRRTLALYARYSAPKVRSR
jgi:hypothetical protein